ncbi:MAG: DUF4190 domain-containing protein [Acidimicrobiales bacterium]
MSDTAQGPGWWLASDGKWYPPELWTGPPEAGPAGMSPAQPSSPASPGPSTVYGAASTPPAAPSYGSAPYGAGGPYPTSGYAQYPHSVGGAAATPKTNGLAVASLICSCAGLFFLPIFPGIILGFVAHSQIKRSNGMQRGDGLAIAGIIVGFGWLVLIALGVVLNATNSTNSGVISAMTVVLVGPAGLVT